MKHYTKLSSIVSTALVALYFLVPVSRGQNMVSGDGASSTGNGSASSAQGSEQGGSSVSGFGLVLNDSGIPAVFERHLVGQFSVGEVVDQGILRGVLPDNPNPALTDSDISSSVAYDLERKHSDYLFDYHVGGRYYNEYPQFNVITHDLGLKQVVHLGPRTTWKLSDRFSRTPDLAGSLMSETLTEEMSFLNPVPIAGIASTPVLGAAFAPLITPADGLLVLRSLQTSNIAQADFTHGLSAQTELAFQAGYSLQRFDDQSLIGTNQYSVSAAIRQELNARTSWGFGFQGGRIDQIGLSAQTTTEAVFGIFTRQLGRRILLSLRGGPARFESVYQMAVPLPPLLATLLDRSSLPSNTTSASFGWLASATLSTSIHNLGISGSYDRSITGTGGLGEASLTQSGTLNLYRKFGRKAAVSLTASYGHFQLEGLQNAGALAQQGLTATFTRSLTSTVDFSTSFVYSKVSELAQGVLFVNGNQVEPVGIANLANLNAAQPGAPLLNHNQVIVRFVYHFPRVRTSGS